jgi:alpha-ribazole phosphatase
VLVVAHAGPIRTALSLATGIGMAALWALRIDPATRVRLHLSRDAERGMWGEIVDIEQP